jgi:hypothetical protein
MLNKSNDDLSVTVTAESPVPIELVGAEEPFAVKHGEVTPAIVFVKIKKKDLTQETVPVTFFAEAQVPGGEAVSAERESAFFGPRR